MFLFVVSILFAFVCFVSPAGAENDWHYPLEIKAGLSSNFGEFRGNRVHTGIDLRTNMQTGYKVYAIDGGKIVRLSVKKSGFGNAVYIQHPNGLMSVYAHLDRFVEEGLGLRTLVKQYQKKRSKKYPGNIYLEKSLKKGQLIAYSGETGYGLPHLHLEVRQGGATPIDPFEHGFSYDDSTPPVIEAFLIEPLGPESTLEGEHFLREYRAEKENGTYLVRRVPRVRGKVRFTASAYDRIGAKNKCAVDRIDLYIAYSAVDDITLQIDKEDFFHNQFDRVTYDTNHRGGLVYDYNFTRLSNPSQYYYRLYNLSPQHFPYRQVFAKNKGVWDTSRLEEGLHTLILETRDAMGNLSVARMQVSVENETAARTPLAVLPQGQNSYLELREFQGFLEILFYSDEALQAAPTLQVSHNNRVVKSVGMDARGEKSFSAAYALSPGDNGMLAIDVGAVTQSGRELRESRQFTVQAVSARRGGTVSYGQKAAMTFPEGALYEDAFANIWPTTSYEVTDGLPLISEVYDFRPAGVPLEKKGSIRIQYPKNVQNLKELGIFWWDHIKKRWYYMDDKQQGKARSLTASIIYPSFYAVLRDTLPPVISDLTPESGSVTKASGVTLSAIIKDVGKGVDQSSIVMTLDGKRIGAEYDPDRRKVSYFLTQTLAPGKHTLAVKASDKAGHPAKTRSVTFRVQ
ncbi:MAG: M23 family metallopeptidase [bacterium]|nr:M23 family metallopeptidase [bacterium]